MSCFHKVSAPIGCLCAGDVLIHRKRSLEVSLLTGPLSRGRLARNQLSFTIVFLEITQKSLKLMTLPFRGAFHTAIPDLHPFPAAALSSSFSFSLEKRKGSEKK